MNKEIIYKTDVPFLKYTVPVIFLIAAILSYLLKANIYVAAFFGVCFISHSFKDYLSITVYKDSFNIAYTNCYGNFMAIENKFYFKEISSFEFNTIKSDLNATKIAFLVAVDVAVPGSKVRFFKDPITYVSVKVKNPLGEIETSEMELRFRGQTYKKALDLIKKNCSSANMNAIKHEKA